MFDYFCIYVLTNWFSTIELILWKFINNILRIRLSAFVLFKNPRPTLNQQALCFDAFPILKIRKPANPCEQLLILLSLYNESETNS